MRNVKVIVILLVVMVATCLTSTTSSPLSHHTIEAGDDLNEAEVKREINVENIEMEAKSNEEKHMWEEMNDWVKAETLENYQNAIPDSLNGQNFIFQILQGKQRDFVIPNNRDSSLNALVKLTIPNKPAKDSNIDLSLLTKNNRILFNTHIYLKKNIKIQGKNISYLLRIKNNYSKDMIIRISFQKKPNLITAINDAKIDPFTTKMKHVLQQIEEGIDEKRMLFKSQMGFMEQQKEHHSNMLILTGLELLTLVGAALIQLFCLKNLIDNKTFV